jgi:Zn-dependent peptidase ImmA (M78 family)/transcriptional regulator with XRE-family HTH domain
MLHSYNCAKITTSGNCCTKMGKGAMETNSLISRRLRAQRERAGQTQEQLSDALGFKDRQIVSKIETGERAISAEELVRLAKHYAQPLEYFTDPFRLDGEARFSWRKSQGADEGKVLAFEDKAARWIALYRLLARAEGQKPSPLGRRVSLTSKSLYEEACQVGEATAKQIGFESVTTQKLKDSLEELGILVLYVDATSEISGAACQIASTYAMDVIFINRNETIFRRKFDLAHEFFHLLTWDVMAPKHFENNTSVVENGRSRGEGVNSNDRTSRVERLADNFASGLLMPMEALEPYLSRKPLSEINSWLNETATTFGVSSSALRYRLKNCGLLSASERDAIDESKIRNNGSAVSSAQRPALFSSRFMDVVGKGIAEGRISVSKCCSLLELSPQKLSSVFTEHGMRAPFEI